MKKSHKLTLALLLSSAAAVATGAASAGTFSTTSNFAYSGNSTIGATGTGTQSVGADIGASASVGGIHRECVDLGFTKTCFDLGAEARFKTSGYLGLNVNTSFGASQATLNYNGNSTTTVRSLDSSHYAIAFTTQQLAQQFSDTGPVANLALDGDFSFAASASARACAGKCASANADFFGNVNEKPTILNANNGLNGSVSLFGYKTAVGLDTNYSAQGVDFTLYSAPKTITSAVPVSLLDNVLSFGADVVGILASKYHLDIKRKVDVGIGTFDYDLGVARLGLTVNLKRQEQANFNYASSVSFVSRQTGIAVEVPIDYTTEKYILNPDASYNVRGHTENCGKSQFRSNQATYLTGSKSPIGSGPASCFTHTITNFTRSQTGLTGNSTSLGFQVGDGSFDFSKVKIVSNTAITGQLASKRSLGFVGSGGLSLVTGGVDVGFTADLGPFGKYCGCFHGNFGPVYQGSIDPNLGDVGIGTQTANFGTINSGTILGFDGATARQAVASLTGTGTTQFFGATIATLLLPNVRVGQAAGGNLTITNTAANDGFSEGLKVTSATSAAGIVHVGALPAGTIAAGGSAQLGVSLDTSKAGSRSDFAIVQLASDGTLINGGTPVALSQNIAVVSAKVYQTASPNTIAPVSFGVHRVGDTVMQTLTITNSAVTGVPVGYQEGLDASTGTTSAGFGASGGVTNLAAGGSSNGITVSLDTSSAGFKAGSTLINLASDGAGTSGLATLDLGSQTVALSGTVNNHANAAFLNGGGLLSYDSTLGGYVFDFGKVLENRKLTLSGFALENFVSGPADSLSGIIGNGPSSIFSLAWPITVGPLGAGSISDQFWINVNTRRAGTFTGELTFNGVGTNASDPAGETRYAALFLTGQVAVPEPAAFALFGLGAAVVLGRRRFAKTI